MRSNHPYIQIPLAEASKPKTPTDYTPLAAPRTTTVSNGSRSNSSVVRFKDGQRDSRSRNRTACQPQRRIAGSREGTDTLRKAFLLSSCGLLSKRLLALVSSDRQNQHLAATRSEHKKTPPNKNYFGTIGTRRDSTCGLDRRPEAQRPPRVRYIYVGLRGVRPVGWACIAPHQVACSISQSLQQQPGVFVPPRGQVIRASRVLAHNGLGEFLFPREQILDGGGGRGEEASIG